MTAGQQPRLPEGVGLTALVTAYARAQESRVPDPLFRDPQAELFVAGALGIAADAGATLPRLGPARDDGSSPLWQSLYAYFSGRTPFYDRFVLGTECDQVVLLGAGLDARAFRLDLAPGVTVYEVDSPAVLDFKDAVLRGHDLVPAARRVPVGVDLRDDWVGALKTAGLDPSRPTAWLAEGLLMYLTAPQADALLDTVTALSAPGSALAGESLNRRTRLDDVPISDAGDRAVAEVFVSADQGGPAAPPVPWLAAHGWTGTARDFTDELAALGRPVPALFDPVGPEPLRMSLFTAARTA